jgi:hypothetical protein
MIGTREISGSAAIKFRNRAIDHALVHVDVDELRAALHLAARDIERGIVVAGRDQLAELGRAGDVRALPDVNEIRVQRQRERLEARQPQMTRLLGHRAR